jgi:hypothetical protein
MTEEVHYSTSERKLQYGIVAYLDVLGTKELGNKKDEDIIKFVESFDSFSTKAAKMTKETFSTGLNTGEKTPKFECLSISDTLVIWGAYESPRSWTLDLHSLSACGFICSLILGEAFKQEIYLRGGIGIGTFYKKSNSIVGRVVAEVAEYYEQPQMIGISLAPSANYVFTARTDFGQGTFVKQDIQLREGIERDAWIVNLPQSVFWATNSKEELAKCRQTIILRSKDPGLSNSLKWRNTLKHWDSVLPSVNTNIHIFK